MKKTPSLYPSWLRLLLLIPLGGIVVYFLLIWVMAYSNPSGFTLPSITSSTYVIDHLSGITSILSVTMNQAETCSEKLETCEHSSYTSIYAALGETKNVPYFQSTYFIRIKDHHIQKLFLSGKFVRETVSTLGEMKAYSFLDRGNDDHLICANFGIDPLAITCLRDFPSDAGAEDIIRIRKDGQTVGAVVKLYGT